MTFRHLLKEIAHFEEVSIQKERDPKKGLAHISKPSDTALKHNVAMLSEQNKNFKDQFMKIQQQCVEIMNEKNRIQEELERAKAELAKLGVKMEPAKVWHNVTLLTLQPAPKKVEEKQKEVTPGPSVQDNSAEMEALKKKLTETQAQLDQSVKKQADIQVTWLLAWLTS